MQMMRWDGIGWDGIGWDGMGWDGIGWDGIWDGIGYGMGMAAGAQMHSQPAPARVRRAISARTRRALRPPRS